MAIGRQFPSKLKKTLDIGQKLPAVLKETKDINHYKEGTMAIG